MSVEFEPNRKGIGQMLRSPEMRNMLSEMGAKCASNAGRGYGHREYDSGQRIVSFIAPATAEAYNDNAQNNTLLKGLHL